jgi:replicative DNA helicase
MPANVDAESFVLGLILLDREAAAAAIGALCGDDFSVERHRRIFKRMRVLQARGEEIDRVTLANELQQSGELASVGGLTYLVSLDDGLPHVPKIDSYIRILREQASLRRVLVACHNLTQRVNGGEASAVIAAAAQELFADVVAGNGELPFDRRSSDIG